MIFILGWVLFLIGVRGLKSCTSKIKGRVGLEQIMLDYQASENDWVYSIFSIVGFVLIVVGVFELIGVL